MMMRKCKHHDLFRKYLINDSIGKSFEGIRTDIETFWSLLIGRIELRRLEDIIYSNLPTGK
jgi:hypothetical protein